MIYLSQRNPLWATKTIGKTKLILGRWGCTISSLSMISDYFKDFRTPAEIAAKDWFNSGGLIVWNRLKFATFKFVTRFYGLQRGLIDEALKNRFKACLLEVNKCHWVVGVRRIPLTDHYIIVDPWTGKKTTTIGKYKVTGGAIFNSK